MVQEEVLDELNKSTLKSYANKAHQASQDHAYDAEHQYNDKKAQDKSKQMAAKRTAGVAKADAKLAKEDVTYQKPKVGDRVIRDNKGKNEHGTITKLSGSHTHVKYDAGHEIKHKKHELDSLHPDQHKKLKAKFATYNESKLKEAKDPHKMIQKALKKIQDRKNMKPVSDKEYAAHKEKSIAARDEYVKKERQKTGSSLYKLSTEAIDPAKAAEQSKKAQVVAKHASEREALAKKHQREKESMKEETFMLSFEEYLKEADMKKAVQYAVGLAKKHAGNMTHAVKSIEKKRKGLSNHPDVANALKTANEDYDKKKTETVKHPNQKVLDVDGDGKIEKSDFEKLRKNKKGKTESSYDEGANKKMKGDDPCWDSHEMVGMKMKNGKKVPNCVPKNEEVETDGEAFEQKSFKSFVTELEFKNGKAVVKGRAYGGAAQHDDDNEFDNDDYGDKEKYKNKLFGKPAKKEPAVKPVKKGRGRPMGSKSGARN